MAILSRLTDYIKSSRGELKQVNWPNRRETLKFTLLIIFISLVVAGFLGFLDYIFQNLINKFIIQI